jgi:hypothetical protein
MGARPAGKRPGRVGPPEAAGVPARQRRRRVEVVGRPARAVLDDQAAGREVGPCSLPAWLRQPRPAAASQARPLASCQAQPSASWRGRHGRPDWPGGPWAEQTCGSSPRTPSRSSQRVYPRRPGGAGGAPGSAAPTAWWWPLPPTGRPPASHRAPREDARPGLRTGGTRVGGASAANRRRPGAGPARRWGPSRVARAGRFG